MKKLIFCKILDLHKWKGRIKPGVKITPEHLESYEAFRKICNVYCERCGKPSKFNLYE